MLWPRWGDPDRSHRGTLQRIQGKGIRELESIEIAVPTYPRNPDFLDAADTQATGSV